MNWPQNLNEWCLVVAGVWAVLVLTGFGMKAFDWLIGWTRRRRP